MILIFDGHRPGGILYLCICISMYICIYIYTYIATWKNPGKKMDLERQLLLWSMENFFTNPWFMRNNWHITCFFLVLSSPEFQQSAKSDGFKQRFIVWFSRANGVNGSAAMVAVRRSWRLRQRGLVMRRRERWELDLAKSDGKGMLYYLRF